MGLLIRAICGDGIEGVGDGDDARQQRDFVAFQAFGVAASVERFVVEFDSGQHFSQLRDIAQDVGAARGVRFHDFKFFGGESAGLF